jgi:hypothetical protein
MFGIEEEKPLSAHWAQGIAWPPPSPKRRTEAEDYGVGRSRKTRAILSPPGGLVKIDPRKFTSNLSLE